MPLGMMRTSGMGLAAWKEAAMLDVGALDVLSEVGEVPGEEEADAGASLLLPRWPNGWGL